MSFQMATDTLSGDATLSEIVSPIFIKVVYSKRKNWLPWEQMLSVWSRPLIRRSKANRKNDEEDVQEEAQSHNTAYQWHQKEV